MNEPNNIDERLMSRRSSLLKVGGVVAAALGAGAWKAGSLADADEAEAAGVGPAAVAAGLVRCVLTPEQTEGPYYVDDARVRRNIRDGKAGTALTLKLTVVNASTCKAIRGAAVDVWHCDALGVYSGVQGNSGTFLRGIQRTNAKGVATFQTVYPGWYPGRTVHIHVKVHIGGNVVHTGQLYFPDGLTDRVYAAAPYSTRPGRNPRNAGDGIYRNGGSRSQMRLSRNGAGYTAALTMGVTRS
jgi:protocatechuate 3,4-dioxygenase beta subunit